MNTVKSIGLSYLPARRCVRRPDPKRV